jgi:opacity protein-like surface antigen
MQTKSIFLSAVFLSLLCSVCTAQTTAAASLYGAFNKSTSGNNTKQSPANAAGGLIELRQIKSPLFGYEVTYAYNRANQGLSSGSLVCPGVSCTLSTAAISANAHEVTGDWVISVKAGSLRPFALAGGGFLLNVPTGGTVTTTTDFNQTGLSAQSTTTAATSTSTKGVFVYGGGLDWRLLPRIGLRLQYRGNLYQASALATAFSSTNAFTHTAEPMIGVYFRP